MTKPLETTLKARIEALDKIMGECITIVGQQGLRIKQLEKDRGDIVHGDYFDEWMKRWKAMQTPMEENIAVPPVSFMSGAIIKPEPEPASDVWPIVLAVLFGVAVGMSITWMAMAWWMGPSNIGSHGKPLSYEMRLEPYPAEQVYGLDNFGRIFGNFPEPPACELRGNWVCQ